MQLQLRAPRVEVWVAIAGLALTGLVWAVRLEGRVDKHTDALALLREDRGYVASKESVEQLHSELLYIRRRLDELVARQGSR